MVWGGINNTAFDVCATDIGLINFDVCVMDIGPILLTCASRTLVL